MASDTNRLLLKDQRILNPSIPLSDQLPASNESYTATGENLKEVEFRRASSILTPLVNRLDALLMVLKTCKGRQCTHPWESLFPTGQVRCLSDALEPQYDHYFEQQLERVRFDRCEKGYIVESEGPMWDKKFAYAMNEEIAFD